MPEVSVVIPVWGEYKKYLPEAIESLSKQTYKDFKVIIADKATNLPTARNLGVKQANTPWVLCLDADDKIEPTFLEKTIGKDDIVSVGQVMFEDEHEIWIPKEHPTFNDFIRGNQIHCASLFKKEVWETVGGFDETMTNGYEDWDFWCQALKAGYTVTTIQEPLFYYRRHGKTMVEQIGNKHSDLHKYILSKL